MAEWDAYLPMAVRWALAEERSLAERAQGAVLFADISGSTRLTAALAQELGSRRGAEELTRQLDRLFTLLITQVHRYGGSVTGFSGDAITCWFDQNHDPNAAAAGRATTAALAMQAAMHSFTVLTTPAGATFALGIKVAIVAGAVRRFVIGDPAIQQLESLTGATMNRLGLAEQQAQLGEVVVGEEIVAQLAPALTVKGWRPAPNGERFAIITHLARAVPPTPWPLPPSIPPAIAQPWLLPPVFQRLQAGHSGFLAELRPVVAFFLKFSGIDYDADEAAGSKLAAYIAWVQRVLARFEGDLLHVTMGDKGSYFNAAFGALQAHEDDPVRAIAAALALQAMPPELRFIQSVQIGIGQDLSFVGAYGSVERRTYGILGNEVNLAARLMNVAQPGEILVTPRIATVTQRAYRFDQLPSIAVKGPQETLTPAVVRGRREDDATPRLRRQIASTLVGRQAEKALLNEQLQALCAGRSQVVILEGEAGIGKSRLLEEVLTQAATLPLVALVGAGDAIENATPYYAWRPIFALLWQRTPWAGMATPPPAHLLAQLGLAGEWLDLLPLLNVVLPLELPESALTQQMIGQARADNTNRLLTEILQQVAASTPLLLVIEDTHWVDAGSWELLLRVQRVVQPLLIIVTTRPLSEPLPPVYQQLGKLPQTTHLALNTLSHDEIALLVCQRLGVAALPPPVAELIRSKAEGHPFFGEELAYHLRDSGQILITPGNSAQEPGHCQLAPQVGMTNFSVPDTIQAVIASRVDRLLAPQQMTLKVASVIGRVFVRSILQDVHPAPTSQPDLTAQLTELQRLGLTLLQSPDPELTYLFKHVITQEVLYEMLLFAQRRQLHAAVARWYETAHAHDLSPFYQLLVHHWQQAEALDLTVDYLEKAGTQALERGVFAAARDHFAKLLQISDPTQSTTAALIRTPARQERRSWWIAKLGQAYFGLGQLRESRQYCEAAIAHFDQAMPASPTRAVGGLLGQLARQTLHRWLPGWFIKPAQDAAERARILEAARLYRQLNTIYLNANEPAINLYTSVRRLNVAERAGISGQLVEAYAVMGYVCSAFGCYGLAERYYAKARQADHEAGEPLALAFALSASGLARLSIGQWPKIREELSEAIAIYQRMGDWEGWGSAVSALGTAERMNGNFARSHELCTNLLDIARQNDNVLHQIWGLAGQNCVALRRGLAQEARRGHEAQVPLLPQTVEQVIGRGVDAILGEVEFIQGNWRVAQEHIGRFLQQVTQNPIPTAIHSYERFFSTSRMLLAIWAATPHDQAVKIQTQQALGLLRTYAFLFPVGRPALHLCQGWVAWLNGKPKSAYATWRKSIALAQKFAMPYEEGLAEYALGQCLAGDDGARHLANAVAIFERLGADYDLAVARQALAKLTRE